ncbi:MAG: phosphoribosyltransferase family protein [Lishizhenia sp.]
MEIQVLSNLQIEQKINRIAFQIIENNFEEPKLFIGGITGKGALLAQRIFDVLAQNSEIQLEFFTLTVDKQNPLSKPIETSVDIQKLTGGVIILVDDVLNSGSTMQYALVKLLEVATKRIKTVALVDRRHRRYPVKCDFVGLTLSTTLKDRVEVLVENKEWKAVLV